MQRQPSNKRFYPQTKISCGILDGFSILELIKFIKQYFVALSHEDFTMKILFVLELKVMAFVKSTKNYVFEIYSSVNNK